MTDERGRLRVLFAIGSLEVGGAERQVVRMLQLLDRSRFTLGLYLVERRGALLAELPDDVAVFACSERVPPARVWLPGRAHRRQVRDLAAALDEFQADRLVAVTFHLAMVAVRAVARRPTTWVALERSNPSRDFPRQVRRFARLKRRLVGRAYRMADRVAAVSTGAARDTEAFYGLPAGRVEVLPNLVEVAEIERSSRESGPNLEPDRFHVVTVGRLSPEKGQRDLLEAGRLLLEAGRVPELRLHFVGDGPERAALEAIAREGVLAGRVRFAGYQRHPAATVARCDLFCLPSHYEGMPGALLEAMALGVPVVATDCESGPREALEGGRWGGLVPVGNSGVLAEAIARVHEDRAAAREVAARGRERIVEEYAAEGGIARLGALIEGAGEVDRSERS